MKKMLALLLAVIMVVSMAACGAQESTPEVKEETAETTAAAAEKDGKQVITVWCCARHDMKYVLPKIEQFNQENEDNIYIDYQIHTDNYKQMVDLAFSTNSGPDIMVFTKFADLAEWLDKGYIAPLDEYLTSSLKASSPKRALYSSVRYSSRGAM